MVHQSNNASRYLLPGPSGHNSLPRLSIIPSGNGIKQEPRAHSPDLSPASHNLHQYQFHFRHPNNTNTYPQTSTNGHSHSSLYRFGGSDSSPHTPSTSNSIMNTGGVDLSGMQHTMSFEDFEDTDELAELPALGNISGHSRSSSAHNNGLNHEKTIRRRSSKACDQCRKSKCKCERSNNEDQCKNCIMMNTPCTFLGPSRKRGPPKGYIDAIEARLHQTEALLGIIISLSSSSSTSSSDLDERAKGLLGDLSKDPLAKEIINRVDGGIYGVKGRKGGLDVRVESGIGSNGKKAGKGEESRSTSPGNLRGEDGIKEEGIDLGATHPSHEWQDQVVAMLRNPGSNSHSYVPSSISSDPSLQRRQRRRISSDSELGSGSHSFSHARHDSHDRGTSVLDHDGNRAEGYNQSDDSDDIMDAVGQLSLNEDEQVRYHGKASGLHLLDGKDRIDRRNEGGIWRFPPARVWPPLSIPARREPEDEHINRLPDIEVQEHLLELYFTYVHPSLPVVHKKSFFDMFKNGHDTPGSPFSDTNSNSATSTSASPFNRRRRRIPTLLLLAMFAVSERYSSKVSPPIPADGSMWVAGDAYLDSAKILLDKTYANSRPSTCQALLLLGYREVGIGAMAQAWVYIGMAVRMAQDLGMHRSADNWARAGLGGRLFSEWELQERKRIWYSCIVMDKYVSTYIGRPVAIFDRDYDTQLPGEDEAEELETWRSHPSPPLEGSGWQPSEFDAEPPAPGRIISCFNASATLSVLLSRILNTVYGPHPAQSRHVESATLEGLLDKWYFELPEHLRYDPGATRNQKLYPHILTLHMQYWCTVLLLHRPFIRNHTNISNRAEDEEVRTIAKKKYDLCTSAASHITSIVSLYAENYALSRSSVFLCFYVFTASVMHVITLSTYPSDPQARTGLTKCMDVLKAMQIVWPSAGRALELLCGSKVYQEHLTTSQASSLQERRKRTADPSFDNIDMTQRSQYLPSRSNLYPNVQDPPAFLDEFGINTASSSPSSLQYYRPEDRWSSNNYNSAPFSGALSTSVLPQQYSTGFDPSSSSRYRTQQNHDGQPATTNRYPQYWSDISTFPQLSTAFGTSGDGNSNHPSSMYIPDQYSIYHGDQQ